MMYVIAIIERYDIKTGTKIPKGFRVFSTDTLSSRDIVIKDFMFAMVRGVSVKNVYFDGTDIQGVGFSIKYLPSCYKYKKENAVDNAYIKTLIRYGEDGADDEYIVVDHKGEYSKTKSEEVSKLVNNGSILNNVEYIPSSKALYTTNKILEVLEGCGCTEIELSNTNVLKSVRVPNGCDLILPATITELLLIKSNTGYLKSITLLTGKDDYTPIVLHAGNIEADNGNKVIVDKVIACDSRSMRSLRCLCNIGCTELVLNYDITSQARETMNSFRNYADATATEAILNGKLKLTVADNNKAKIETFSGIQGFLRGKYGLNNSFYGADDIVNKIGINGVSKNQHKALQFISIVEPTLCEDTKEELEKWINSFNNNIEDVLREMCISKYPTHGGMCIRREPKIIQCSKAYLTKKEEHYGYNITEVAYIHTADCIKRKGYLNSIEAPSYRVDQFTNDCNLVLVGINKSVKDDVVYGVIEIKVNPKDKSGSEMLYKSFYNMSVADVISRLDKKPGMAGGSIIRHSGYIFVTSIGDTVAFNETKMQEIIEGSQSKQMERLISINNMLDRDSDYDITDLGVVTRCKSNDDRAIRLPKGTTEVGFKAIDYAGTIKEMIIPAGVKPLTKDRFYYADNSINRLIVYDRFNAESGLILGATWSEGYGVSEVIYNVDSQKEMMKLFIKIWDKPYFLNAKGILDCTEQLDVEHSKKLLATLMNKSGFTSYIQATENTEISMPWLHIDQKMGTFKRFLKRVERYINEDVHNIVRNVVNNH